MCVGGGCNGSNIQIVMAPDFGIFEIMRMVSLHLCAIAERVGQSRPETEYQARFSGYRHIWEDILGCS